MRTIFFACLGVIVLLLAGVLIVPSFFDWNEYKPEIAEQVRAETGRDLEIGGDISLRLIPSPALVVEDIRFANAPDGVAEDMVRVALARVDVAFWPLLGFSVEVSRIHLVDPVVALEVLADGRGNWEFGSAAEQQSVRADEAGAPGPSNAAADRLGKAEESSSDSGLPAIRLDDIAIENATVTYRNLDSGTVERVDALTASLRAVSLDGPLEASGSLRFRDIPLGFEVGLGNLREQSMVPTKLVLREIGDAVRAEISGFVFDLAKAPRFAGSIRAEGDFLSSAIQRFSPQSVPGFLAQPFVFDGAIEAAEDVAAIDVREIRLGDTVASGAIKAVVAPVPVVDVDLKVRGVDLDTWLSMPPARLAGGEPLPEAASEPTTAIAPEPQSGGAQAPLGDSSMPRAKPSMELPNDIDVRMALAVEAIAFRGGVVREAQLNGRLAGGEVTVSQITATGPGGVDVAVFGFVTAATGAPLFDGEIDVRALDLRGTLDWLGVGLSDVPPGRLRGFEAHGKVRASAGRIEARDLVIGLDGARIGGGVTAVLADRPAFGIGLTIDHLDLDGFLSPPMQSQPQDTQGPAGSPESGAAAAASNGNGTDQVDSNDDSSETGSSGGGVLTAFDADMRLRAGSIGWQGLAANDVVAEGKLIDGVLTLERVAVGEFAGASGEMSGRISDLAGQPVLDGVEFRAVVADPGRIARLLDQPLPPELYELGAVQASGRIAGTLGNPTFDATVDAAGVRVRANGAAEFAAGPAFNGRIEIHAADSVPAISGLTGGYRPVGPLGATALSADASFIGGLLTVRDLTGTLVGVDVSGVLDIDTRRSPIFVSADLATGNLVVDPLLPAKRQAGTQWRLIPAAWSGPRSVPVTGRSGIELAAVHSRWSTDPIDLSGLATVDADVKWRSRTVSYGALSAADVDLTAALAAGVLTVPRLDAAVFGGALRATSRLDASRVPVFDVDLSLDNANLSELAAVGGGGLRSGRFTMRSRLSGGGQSEADIIASLGGDGQFEAVGLDPDTDVDALPLIGPMMGSVLRVTSFLDSALGALLGGGSGGGVADVRASYTIDRGVVVYDDLAFQSPLYAGTATGRIDLPQWTIDTRGVATLDQSKLGGSLLSGIKEIPREIRFAARGSIDDPKISADTSGFKAIINTIPGLDSLRKQPGIGEAIDQLLPGRSGSPGGTPAPPKVDDILRGIFR